MSLGQAPHQAEQARFSKLGDLERQLDEQRAVDEQLGRELEALLARIADVERRPAEDDGARERARREVEALREEIARVDSARFDARGRILRLERAVAQLGATRRGAPPGRGAPPTFATAPQPRRRRPLRAAALLLTGLLALAGAAAGGAAWRAAQEERPAGPAPAPAPNRPAAAPDASGPVGTPPPCSAADTAQPTGVVRCTTGRTLVIAAVGTPIQLPDLRVRVLRAERFDDRVDVRLRLDARTDGPQPIGARQIVLDVGAQRLFGLSIGPPPRLRPGVPTTLDLRFALTPEAIDALERDDGRADLGISPFATGAREFGVVRLRLDESG